MSSPHSTDLLFGNLMQVGKPRTPIPCVSDQRFLFRATAKNLFLRNTVTPVPNAPPQGRTICH